MVFLHATFDKTPAAPASGAADIQQATPAAGIGSAASSATRMALAATTNISESRGFQFEIHDAAAIISARAAIATAPRDKSERPPPVLVPAPTRGATSRAESRCGGGSGDAAVQARALSFWFSLPDDERDDAVLSSGDCGDGDHGDGHAGGFHLPPPGDDGRDGHEETWRDNPVEVYEDD